MENIVIVNECYLNKIEVEGILIVMKLYVLRLGLRMIVFLWVYWGICNYKGRNKARGGLSAGRGNTPATPPHRLTPFAGNRTIYPSMRNN